MMRNGIRFLIVLELFFLTTAVSVCQAKEAGIFYSTLYAKTVEVELLRLHGGNATAWFLKDVNGDGKDDAIAYYGSGDKEGQWYVALSDGKKFGESSMYLDVSIPESDGVPLMGDVNGDGKDDVCLYNPLKGCWYACLAETNRFLAPVLFAEISAKDSSAQFLADMNGDGRADAVLAWTGTGEWLAGLSTGDAFDGFNTVLSGFGNGADQCFMADVNGDAKSDAIAYDKTQGQWEVALFTGPEFKPGTVWRNDFGTGKEFGFVCNIDGDQKADIGYFDHDEWWVSYSDGETFVSPAHCWIGGLGPSYYEEANSKTNPPPIVAFLTGSISGNEGWACIVDQLGRWYGINNNNNKNSANRVSCKNNTWVKWGCAYIPQIPGQEGTYDSGDPAVNDTQIQMMHDAGFTYIMLDITNGRNDWIDSRAKRVMERIRYWNDNRRPEQHKIHACIALGRTRGIKGKKEFFEKLNLECKRAWDEFYLPYQDIYYKLHGKPLVIHMITTGLDYYYDQNNSWSKHVASWSGGDRTYLDRVTSRAFAGNQAGAHREQSNMYGWVVPDKFGNPVHPEMMPVMPGFWNGRTYCDREGGDFYRSHWMRVIQYQPESVFVNSMNETWEHTSVEPSYMFKTRLPHEGLTMWTDAYGDRMDDFYWEMTRQYMKLYMDGVLYENTYFQEYIREGKYGPIYKVTENGLILQQNPPHQAPVLLLPAGFIREKYP